MEDDPAPRAADCDAPAERRQRSARLSRALLLFCRSTERKTDFSNDIGNESLPLNGAVTDVDVLGDGLELRPTEAFKLVFPCERVFVSEGSNDSSIFPFPYAACRWMASILEEQSRWRKDPKTRG